MKAFRALFLLITVFAFSYLANSQPPEEFDNPKVDFFWIAFDYNDTVEGMNGAFPIDDPGEDGTWHAYIDDITFLPWFNTWFYNGPLNLNNMKKVRMGFWVVKLNPGGPQPTIDWVINWSSNHWPADAGYPGPGDEMHVLRSPLTHLIVPDPVPPATGTWVEMYFEIPYYNPEWLSVDVMGINIALYENPMPPPPSSPLFYWWNYALTQQGTPPPGGIVVHECLPKSDPTGFDFGDAPELDTAYLPLPVVIGNFPTCVQVGLPNSYISHGCTNPLFFGGYMDCETEGNYNWCPVFGPNQYNSDECGTIPYSFPNNPDPDIGLVDEGLFLPVPNTLGLYYPSGFVGYFVCGAGNRQPLDTVCGLAQWGQNIDIWIDSRFAIGGVLNILFDWNQDGDWNDVVQCGSTQVSEHALVNYPVRGQYWGPASIMPPVPPAPPLQALPIQTGPNGGYMWARFTLTEQPVQLPWDGSGIFADGETEDYLLYLAPESATIPLSDWAIFIGILFMIFLYLFFFWKRR